VFCALCFIDSANQLPIECNKDVGFSTDKFPKFSALIDFDDDRENVVEVLDENCGVGHVYNKLLVSTAISICVVEGMHATGTHSNFKHNILYVKKNQISPNNKSKLHAFVLLAKHRNTFIELKLTLFL
jgi:hypothetical protein